jgi:hypothetical protein
MAKQSNALLLAEQKLGEARAWWLAWWRALNRYRVWTHVYLIHRPGTRLAWPYRTIKHVEIADYAADQMLVATEAIVSCARAAASSEMASRIYYEEHEERETTFPDPDDP